MPSAARVQITRPAFTLVELLIVLAILVIAGAIVIPNIGSAADAQVIAAAQVLQSDLEVARSMAMTTQRPHSVVFSADRQSYKVVANYAGETYSSATAVWHPVVAGKRFEVTLGQAQGMGGVTVETVDFGGSTYVTFDSQGEPSAGGTVTLRAGQTQMQVSVTALTGRITATRTSG